MADPIILGIDPGLDIYGRTRVAQPATLFDSQLQYNVQPWMWESVTSGGGEAITHKPNESGALIETAADSEYVIRQTYQYFPHQPGKPTVVLLGFAFGAHTAGATKRVGLFDNQNGVYLERADDGLYFVERSYVTGSIVNTRVDRTVWNIERYLAVDDSKAQILALELSSYGAGAIRCGFVLDGKFWPCHQFNHANVNSTSSLTTLNLPVRYELRQSGATAAGMRQLYCSVTSEGGIDPRRGEIFSVSNGTTAISVTTRRPVLTIRPLAQFNSIANRAFIESCHARAYVTTQPAQLELVYGGASTKGGGATWVAVSSASSAVEYSVDADAISGGVTIDQFAVPAGTIGGADLTHLLSKFPLALDYAGSTARELALVATSFSTAAAVSGTFGWKEIK